MAKIKYDFSKNTTGEVKRIPVAVDICGNRRMLNALIDTGSNITLVNKIFIPTNAKLVGKIMVGGLNGYRRNANGEQEPHNLYCVDITIWKGEDEIVLENACVAEIIESSEEVILGTNIIDFIKQI